MTFEKLIDLNRFTRKEFYDAYSEETGDKTADALDYALRREIAKGTVIHIGRNQYTFEKSKRVYEYSYSEEAKLVVRIIEQEYPQVDFQIFELVQLNEFVNHLFAHNTIFVSVENEAVDYVFDSLRNAYPGKVLLKPKADDYYRYLVEDQIVILRLPSESPKGVDEPWKSRLERILVDITVDKLLSQMVSTGEYEAIFSQASDRYVLDVAAMKRYANRKGAGKRFSRYLSMYMKSSVEG